MKQLYSDYLSSFYSFLLSTILAILTITASHAGIRPAIGALSAPAIRPASCLPLFGDPAVGANITFSCNGMAAKALTTDVSGTDIHTFGRNSAGTTNGNIINFITSSNSGGAVVTSVSVPNSRTYITGQSLSFVVHYASPVIVTGTPTLPITLTSGTVNATYLASDGQNLTFSYTVQTGDKDLDGIALGSVLTLTGGATIRDANGTNANLALNGVASTTGLLVDGIAPVVSSITRQIPAGATVVNGISVTYEVIFSKPVTGVDITDFTVTATSGTASGFLFAISGSENTWFVTITSLGGNGTIRLDVKSSGTGIKDLAGLALSGGFTTGDMYTISTVPLVTASGGNTTYLYGTGGGTPPPVAIDPGIIVVDLNNSTLVAATVAISSGYTSSDMLNFVNQAGILGTYNSGSGILTLTGSANLAQYQAALRSITFTTSVPPTTTVTRGITIRVSDPTETSAGTTKDVALVAGPAFANGATQTASVCENSTGGVSINSLLATSDPTSGHVLSYTVVTGPTHGTLNGFPGSVTSTGGTVQPAGAGITYVPTSGYQGTDQFVLAVSYNGSAYARTTVNVTVHPLPTVPAITGPSSVCSGSTITLADATTDGVWSSGTTAAATIDASTGVVTGAATGTSMITYTIMDVNTCSASVTAPVAVNPTPAQPSVITGPSATTQGEPNVVYSVVNDPTVSYSWRYTGTGFAIVNTNQSSVFMSFANNGTGGTLSVEAVSKCNASIVSTASTLAVTVSSTNILVSSGTIPTTTVGVAYTLATPLATFTATGAAAPYTFAVTAGALPSGMTLGLAGSLIGTASEGGIFPITVTVTDAIGQHGSVSTSVTVGAPTMVLSPVTLPNGTYGTLYPTTTIAATGGTGPYTFAVLSGALPTGVNLNHTTGEISGTPTTHGTFSFTVEATDASTGTGPFHADQSYTLTINQVPLTITVDNQSSIYGGQIPTLTASYTGFVNRDNAASLATAPTLSTTATSASPVGPYTITASGAVDNNYTISYVQGTLTIGQAPLTVTADNQSSIYGAPIPALTASYSGFVNGDNATSLTTAPTLSTTATAASPVGPYTITASGAVDGNYTISYATGTLTIGKASLTITADNEGSTYGSPIPGLTASYSGFVNGDNAGSLTTPPTLTTAATSASPVGPYTITASGAVDDNYTISYATGTLTIGKATLTITADNQSSTYGSPIPTLTASYSGFVNGDNATSLTTAPTLSTAATSTSSVGPYTITASGAVADNYTISYATGTLTIGKAALTITADNQGSTYGSPIPALTASYSGFINGDNAGSLTTAPTISTSATSTSPVGPYTITASGAVDDNYTISYTTGTLTIGKATLTITAADQSRYYQEPNPAFTVTYSGFVNGDGASILTSAPVATTTATLSSAPGQYPITASGAAAANYAMSYQDGTFTILMSIPNVTTFGALPVKTYGDEDFVISASATSRLPVTFTSRDNSIATVTQDGSGNWTVHIVGAGQVTIAANQAGDPPYAPAAEVDEVLMINKADQAIVFQAPPATGTTGQTITLMATASSGLPVIYTVSPPTLAAVSGNSLTLTGTGTATITATQPGDDNYNAAIPVSDTIQIFNSGGFHSGIGVFPNPAHGTLHIRYSEDYVITKVVIFDERGRIVLGEDQVAGGNNDLQLNVSSLQPGLYILRVVCIRNNSLVYPVFKIEIQ